MRISSHCVIYQKGSAAIVLPSFSRINWNDWKLKKHKPRLRHLECLPPLVNEACEDVLRNLTWNFLEIFVLFLKTSFVVFQLILRRRPRLGNAVSPGNDDVNIIQ